MPPNDTHNKKRGLSPPPCYTKLVLLSVGHPANVLLDDSAGAMPLLVSNPTVFAGKVSVTLAKARLANVFPLRLAHEAEEADDHAQRAHTDSKHRSHVVNARLSDELRQVVKHRLILWVRANCPHLMITQRKRGANPFMGRASLFLQLALTLA